MLFDNDLTFLQVINLEGEDSKVVSTNLVSTTEGFIRGNMFEKEYEKYKDYKYKMPKTCSEKTAHLYKIMELSFAINDLNLWLDIHPNDEKIFLCLKECLSKLASTEKEYVEKYGPIEIEQNCGEKNKWLGSWPWEAEDSVYV